MNNPITQAIEALEAVMQGSRRTADGKDWGRITMPRDAAMDKAEAALASLRAVQEVGLPPLPPLDGFSAGRVIRMDHCHEMMREYARTAIAAAGGGVPHDALIQARDMLENWSSYVPPYFAEKHGLKDDFATLDKWIASSPQPEADFDPMAGYVPVKTKQTAYGPATAYVKAQPEAAPAVAQVPQGWKLVPSGALAMVVNALRRDAEEGRPVRGEMADELLAAAPEAPAQAAPSAGEVERDRKDAERYRWLRQALSDRSMKGRSHWFCLIDEGHPEELDAAIDAALSHKEQS